MQLIQKLKLFTQKHWKAMAAGIAVVGVTAGGIIWLRTPPLDATERVSRKTSTRAEAALTKPGLLTGLAVEPRIAERPVTGIMIENSPAARPQSGLDAAGIVFEAVAEGGITRFLALYQESTPAKLGPVRSLRPYFLDWVMGFDAPIAHVGGSAQALSLVRSRSAKDLDQFRYSAPYYRSGDRFAPHNVYTSMQALRQLQKRLGYSKSEFKPIPRSDGKPAARPNATTITVDYSSSLYQAQFRYRKSSNNYARWLAGSPHRDRETGQVITAKNVVVIKMPTHYSGRYAVMQTIGSGEALVFKNGTVQAATWQQPSYNQRIRLFDQQGGEVALNRGKTWFAILPSQGSVTY